MRLLVLLVVLLAACAGGQEDDPVMQPPTATAPAAGAEESLTGVLGGDATLEGGCAWLTEGATRWEVKYPEGWAVAFDPLTLTGPDGQTAGEGDTVTVTGAPVEDAVTVCQVGPVWGATGVEL
jgi:hypothetical protein